LSERVLIERRWLRLREQRVQLANGHEIEEFHLVDGPDWALVLAITPQQEVVMVRQYRHGMGAESLEMPAGVIEPGEPELLGAQREFREETGYAGQDWHPLLVVSTEPARQSVRAHFFVALAVELAGSVSPEPSEVLQVELHPARSLGKLIDSGQIRHGVHVAAILLAARRGFLELD
jgi:8-oxo-dGTP pyrophosphatase MutT (NUDIX family)